MVRRVLNSPWLVAAIVALVYGVFIANLLDARDGDVSRFVVAGGPGVDRARVPAGLTVTESGGYDGAMFYRLALDPFTREETAHGITLDNPPYRQQRIGYPLLVWLGSLGRPALVPWVMVLVNWLALIAIACFGAAVARHFEHHALWGLLAAAYPGYLLTLSRDLSEAVAAAFTLAATWGVLRERPRLAGALLAYAVLTRETVLILPLAMAAVWIVRRRGAISVWLVPIVAYAAMQLFVWWQWGAFGVFAAQPEWTTPFSEWLRFTSDAAPRRIQLQRLYFNEAMLWLVIVVASAAVWWRSKAPEAWKLAWAAQLGFGSTLPHNVWLEDFGFMRILTDLFLLSAILLLGGSRVARLIVLLASLIVWVHVARHQIALR